MTTEPLTWRETVKRMRGDHRRLVETLNAHGGRRRRSARFHPSFLCMFLHRVSHYLFRRRRYYLSRLVWHANMLLTGADISELTDLGEGAVVVQTAGLSLMGRAGRNLTVMPSGGFGSEVGRRQDIGAGPGLPLLGDDVVIEARAGILGPVRVGSRVLIRPGVVVVRDVPDDSVVESRPSRILDRSGVA